MVESRLYFALNKTSQKQSMPTILVCGPIWTHNFYSIIYNSSRGKLLQKCGTSIAHD